MQVILFALLAVMTSGGAALPYAHPRLTIVRLQDATDHHNELDPSPEFELDVSPFLSKVEKVRTLAGRGCAELRGSNLSVTVPEKLDFIWIEFFQ